MSEALARIKEDLGPNAVILSIKNIRRRRLFGLLGKNMLEVVAGVNPEVKPSRKRRVRITETRPPVQPSQVEEDIDVGIRRALDDIYADIVKKGVIRELAQRSVFLLDDIFTAGFREGRELAFEEIKREFANRIGQIIPISGEIHLNDEKAKVVAIVGPTGVGKTTTTAKLAAIYSIMKGHDVGLVSIDAYRIAAFEQLKTYADIINLPIKLATSPQEAREAVDSFKDKEIIFVDTVGRSPTHQVHMAELKAYVSSIRPDEVHLALTSTTKYQDLLKVIDEYGELSVTNLIFTKVDETTSLDSLVNIAYTTRYPISYFGTGQDVPDDIEPASIDRIVDFMLNPDLIGGILSNLRIKRI
jgi:flagellar biosynthesis protein FlhF